MSSSDVKLTSTYSALEPTYASAIQIASTTLSRYARLDGILTSVNRELEESYKASIHLDKVHYNNILDVHRLSEDYVTEPIESLKGLIGDFTKGIGEFEKRALSKEQQRQLSDLKVQKIVLSVFESFLSSKSGYFFSSSVDLTWKKLEAFKRTVEVWNDPSKATFSAPWQKWGWSDESCEVNASTRELVAKLTEMKALVVLETQILQEVKRQKLTIDLTPYEEKQEVYRQLFNKAVDHLDTSSSGVECTQQKVLSEMTSGTGDVRNDFKKYAKAIESIKKSGWGSYADTAMQLYILLEEINRRKLVGKVEEAAVNLSATTALLNERLSDQTLREELLAPLQKLSDAINPEEIHALVELATSKALDAVRDSGMGSE